MELCLRRTFIDVVEPFEEPTRRSRSLSPPRSAFAENDAFIREKEYVESMSMWMKKIEPLSAVSDMRLTAKSLMMLPEYKKRVNDVNFLSASTTASSAPRTDGQPVYLFDDDLESECDERDGDNMEKHEDVARVGIGVAKSLIPVLPTYCNTGSRGHPELCMKPCLYFTGGRCDSMTCGYCHYDHEKDKRHMHLDKRKRKLLKELSFADCIDMLIPILQKRANLIGMNASKLFVTLLSYQDNATPATTTSRETQGLVRTMRSMSFRSIVAVLIGRSDAPAAFDGGVINGMLDELCMPRT